LEAAKAAAAQARDQLAAFEGKFEKDTAEHAHVLGVTEAAGAAAEGRTAAATEGRTTEQMERGWEPRVRNAEAYARRYRGPRGQPHFNEAFLCALEAATAATRAAWQAKAEQRAQRERAARSAAAKPGLVAELDAARSALVKLQEEVAADLAAMHGCAAGRALSACGWGLKAPG
jgi:hypothetical protein